MTPTILCAIDQPPPTVRTLLEVYYRFMGYTILYVSTRPDSERPQVSTWLRDRHCPPGPLVLRGDTCPTGLDVRFAISDSDELWGYRTFHYKED